MVDRAGRRQPVEPPLWTEGASPWPLELEALAFVRSRLPNHEPYRASTNVEFYAGDASTVGDVLGRVDQLPDFDPWRDHKLTEANTELTKVERNARAPSSVDETDLEIG